MSISSAIGSIEHASCYRRCAEILAIVGVSRTLSALKYRTVVN